MNCSSPSPEQLPSDSLFYPLLSSLLYELKIIDAWRIYDNVYRVVVRNNNTCQRKCEHETHALLLCCLLTHACLDNRMHNILPCKPPLAASYVAHIILEYFFAVSILIVISSRRTSVR